MRAFVFLGAAVFHSIVWQVNAHPLCYYDDKPTDPDQELLFCPEQNDGACCNDVEELAAITEYQRVNPNGTALSSECAAFYRQVSSWRSASVLVLENRCHRNLMFMLDFSTTAFKVR